MDEIGCEAFDCRLDLAAAVADAGVVVCYELGAFADEAVYQDGVPLVWQVTVSNLTSEKFMGFGMHTRSMVDRKWLSIRRGGRVGSS